MTNLEWLHSLEPNELSEWFAADHVDTRAERTCHKVIPNEMEGNVFCSECKAEIGEYSYPNYCHMCGAKVIGGAE